MTARSRRRDEHGYAGVVTALFVSLLMLPLCAVAIDLGRIHLEGQRLQNAADAAAMAGVTFLPDDFAKAREAAIEAARRNGFPNADSTSVDVQLGSKPTQLRVTVGSVLDNSFAAGFGIATADVARRATADYNAPAPMGSPCNAYGNAPLPGASETRKKETGVEAAAGGATCSDRPDFWAAIAGPETPKSQGDAIMTRRCGSSSESGCQGTVNAEFDPAGYFYSIRVAPEATGTPLTVQLYDPAHVTTGDKCESGPSASGSTTPLADAMNPFTTDGTTRYAKGVGPFCNGDVGSGVVTSYGLRRPTDTQRPTDGAPMTDCARQFPSYAANAATTATLRERLTNGNANTNYRPNVAQVFRQWVDLCTFTPDEPGTYYLQVRTNVALGGTRTMLTGGRVDAGDGIWQGNGAVFSQSGDDPGVAGSGNNRFTIRAVGQASQHVSVSGTEEMGVYANYPAAGSAVQTRFNLVRVVPAAATKTLIVTIFDIGDGGANGTLQVLPPVESGLTLDSCTGTGPRTGALQGCTITGIKAGSPWEARTQVIRVPIPASYSCTVAQFGGCWFRLAVSFPDSLTDTTTWTARVEGDPVRLIE